ncbi:hypothetical protein L6452_17545 [Arctium lappa]|uniref:Uncharacterized protein n=1 Tax=Arctium lappa TaxID=4217 RepID=A0ACB9C3U9_ARCLA|nr:hypothetical protein L6452_17545 [Arctium lappa]
MHLQDPEDVRNIRAPEDVRNLRAPEDVRTAPSWPIVTNTGLRRDRTPSIDTTTLRGIRSRCLWHLDGGGSRCRRGNHERRSRARISESRMGFGSGRGAEEVAASGGGSGDGQGGYRSGAYD